MRVHVFVASRNPAWLGKCAFQYSDTGSYCRLPEFHRMHDLSDLPHNHVVTCPFKPHGSPVEVRPLEPGRPAADRGIIEYHKLGFDILRDQENLACPASLMHWPLSNGARATLAQQAKDLTQQFNRDTEAEADEGDWEFAGEPDNPQSQPIKHKGRMGREPEPTSADWALNGREDEDIIPEDQVVTGVVPDHVQGQSVGRSGMLGHNVAIVQGALARTDQVISLANEAAMALDGVVHTVVEIKGDGHSETLIGWLTNLESARLELDKIRRHLSQANERGQSFINIITS